MKHSKHAFETHEKTPENISHVGKHKQHPNKTPANIRLENEIKHSEHTLETYVYNHSNMCNILIYFCNIKMKHSQTYR
jgi:alpha-N-acetylglucosamine transferase